MVTCRDLLVAITQGDTREKVLAEDCMKEAIAARIDDGRDIPSPSVPKRGELPVSVPPSMALKAAVYLAVREAPSPCGFPRPLTSHYSRPKAPYSTTTVTIILG